MRVIALLLLIAPICYPQTAFVGAVAGGRLTDDVAGSARPESRRYVVGPMIELTLPLNFSVEFEAMYHRHGYSADAFNMAQFQIDRERGKFLGISDLDPLQTPRCRRSARSLTSASHPALYRERFPLPLPLVTS